MEIAFLSLLIGIFILLMVILVLGTVHPFWAIVDCAVSTDHGKGSKALWILGILFTWTIGSVLYGLFSTRSPKLKKVTVSCSVLVLALGRFKSRCPKEVYPGME
jgi:hypothetical protein